MVAETGSVGEEVPWEVESRRHSEGEKEREGRGRRLLMGLICGSLEKSLVVIWWREVVISLRRLRRAAT